MPNEIPYLVMKCENRKVLGYTGIPLRNGQVVFNKIKIKLPAEYRQIKMSGNAY